MPGSLLFAALLVVPAPLPLQQETGELVEVAGNVVVEDENGAELAEVSGVMHVVVWSPEENGLSSGTSQRVAVDAGCFSLSVLPGVELDFRFLRIDGGTAFCLPLESGLAASHDEINRRRPIPAGKRFEIRACLVPPTIVHVVDAESGVDLDQIAILAETRSFNLTTLALPPITPFALEQIHPPAGAAAKARGRSSADSPLTLTIDGDAFASSREALWVRAPGSTWGRVLVDYVLGGEHLIRLARGGTLIVRSTSRPPPPDAYVIVYRSWDETRDPSADVRDEIPVLVRRLSRSGETFEGIAVGAYRVSLELGGSSFEESVRLAGCDVNVESGGRAVALLDLKEMPAPPEPIALAGTIRVPPTWGDLDFEVDLRPERVSALSRQTRIALRREKLDQNGEGVWALPPSRLAPGRYALEVDAFGIRRALIVTSKTPPISIDVPPPVDVTVHVVDSRSGAPIACLIAWRLVEAGQQEPWTGSRNHAYGSPPPTDVQEIRLPVGRISFAPWSIPFDDFDRSANLEIDVGPETRELTLALVHLTGIRVRIAGSVRDESSARDRFQHLRILGADGIALEPSLFSSRIDASLGDVTYRSQPGRHRVTLSKLPGFKAVEPQEVLVHDGEITPVVLELVREK